MTKKIFRSICLVAVAVLIAALILIMGVLYDYFSIIQKEQLRAETELAATGVEQNGINYLETLILADTRITWIAADGTVLYDSDFDIATMDDHTGREEIREALENGYGESTRYSDTLMAHQLYAAQKLDDGSVLRLGTAQKTILTLIFGMLQPTVIVLVGATLLSFFLALGISRKIVKPLNELDLDNIPAEGGEYEEIRPLLRRLSSQKVHLKRQESELRRKQEEFDAATDGMSEGLILIGEKRMILSMNRSAAKILNAKRQAVGLDISVIDPDFDLEFLLEKAESEGHAEKIVTKHNMTYRLIASPIQSEKPRIGFTVFLFNITEKENAEKMRREFTANVSHELKTPLHSISGCAELLSHGMVKPEDTSAFAGQIYTEAGRMIRLIDDIIKLSRLDEGEDETGKTDVDLYTLTECVVEELRLPGVSDGIDLTLEGESAVINGFPQMLTAIVKNLCSNAIKYNKEGGYVKVSVNDHEDHVTLTVKDNGIGIAKEYHERIFERFFRVDKSHSKEVGGTGLGLSIVKHAAKLHHATITLDSAPNKGTTITVTFPK